VPGRLLPFVVVLLISFYALFSPASGVPFLPPGVDKLGHFALFAALAWTGRRAGIPVVGLALGLLGYAVGSEILQAVLPLNRDGDVWDGLTDLSGAGIGMWLARRDGR
jgi:VanZ family protein